VRAAVVLAGLFGPGLAVAAPFCLHNQGMAPMCQYYDATECQRDARQQGGDCVVNQTEVSLPRGTGDYCMVTSSRATLCMYADLNSCSRDAQRQGGVCVQSPQASPARAPDPYSDVNGR
jgi:hypothetical protein